MEEQSRQDMLIETIKNMKMAGDDWQNSEEAAELFQVFNINPLELKGGGFVRYKKGGYVSKSRKRKGTSVSCRGAGAATKGIKFRGVR